ncbi:hypothetical protein PPL_00007 [Heterostelium album PN500]|uniref:Uncharacterized protein n=1 Tax=Heterostelium pallidum (strain ATCC 26659 / Pp 5 / PN500) TaxID=670386 RepID=D3BVK6_HETP5|nr:hypothetical protein PPL_00007 [Heterostelium album PN500]EFA74509.1 hypothetical protein PPL_00007 [Heterostelium album PN500]|eukprot:XP_020426643.1 hypothetical protein PPL_00007 [Heterostelium album PN500]
MNDLNNENKDILIDTINNNNNENNIDSKLLEVENNTVTTIDSKFKNSSTIEVYSSVDEVLFVPQNAFKKDNPATKKAGSIFEVSKDDVWKDEAVEFPSELPSSISCTPFLKAFLSCYSPSGMIRNLYRFGEFKCDVEAENFRDCTNLSITSSSKRQAELDKILTRRKQASEETIKNHVWKERTEPLENDYFGYNIDLVNFIAKSRDSKYIETLRTNNAKDSS